VGVQAVSSETYPEYQARRHCRQKQAYTEEVAREKARKTMGVLNEHIQAYKCRVCEFWHIGHAPALPRVRP